MPASTRRSRPLAAATMALALPLVAAAVAAGGGSPPQASAPFLDLRRQQPVTGDARAGEALSKVCGACHGERGLGVAPTFPALAGQSATYLYVQLKSFKGGQRHDPAMTPMVADLDDAGMRDLAAFYASLPPGQGPGGAPASPGGSLFGEGDPARGIPPCQGCHGPAGEGPRVAGGGDATTPRPPWATVPRLQGQSAAYVAKALHDFRGGARGSTSNALIMHGVATTLDEADIQSLADYLAAR